MPRSLSLFGSGLVGMITMRRKNIIRKN
ncbi:MAG TPA: hypothetical protein ENG51_03950 [Deltaproteobacteria bacterium]|nr:MAG: hypothetical protein DRG83_10440 [Deltaproteobacteria bacterium]RLB08343.1 MAG: hypothetical protein DRG59_05300 [Deltaproteobacteria bacterium]HDM75606.1 hypothetical protein [Deltaproteobacteria bacterium]